MITCVVYFIAAACEELGWTGYAIDPIQKRWGALTASLLVGIVWQVWHFIGDLQAGQTWTWIAWHSLYSVALRVLIVWIYNNTGKSVFAAILVHTMDNVSWSLLPIFDSSFGSILTTAIAWLVIAIVVFVSARRNR
jgi:membrane protease YdiL (CAAX protease family)